MLKSVLTHAAALTIGGVASFFVTKMVYKKYYEDLIDREVESVKETFKNYRLVQVNTGRANGKTEAAAKVTDKDVEDVFRQNLPNSPLTRSSLDANPNEVAKRNYHLIRPQAAKTQQEENERDEDHEDEEEDMSPDEDAVSNIEPEIDGSIDRTAPYIIDDIEFSETFDHHEKVSLYYYREDDVLAQEDEEVVEDSDNVIGMEAFEKLNMQTTVWVRNEVLGIDYEIVALNKSYAETVGIMNNLSPREKYLRQQKRRDDSEE